MWWENDHAIEPIHNRWNQNDYYAITIHTIHLSLYLSVIFGFIMTLLHVEILIFIECLSFGGLSGIHEDFHPSYSPKDEEEGLNHVKRHKREGRYNIECSSEDSAKDDM